jgi:hypothetical protein
VLVNVHILRYKTKNIVIASIIVLFLLVVMLPITQVTSAPIDEQIVSLPERLTMEELLELTGAYIN